MQGLIKLIKSMFHRQKKETLEQFFGCKGGLCK